ncbi:MAG TPA: alternative ribosome rescue aminoacyl-tRNA hydrolase ArfB [Actinomycetota bacterium]
MDDLTVANGITIPRHELTVRFSRSGGPGGQNVNKRATRAEVVFDLLGSPSIPGELKRRAKRRLRARLDTRGRLRVVADDERTQRANREIALERLTDLLRAAFEPPPPPRRKTKPTRSARERRLSEKKRRGVIKRARRTPSGE